MNSSIFLAMVQLVESALYHESIFTLLAILDVLIIPEHDNLLPPQVNTTLPLASKGFTLSFFFFFFFVFLLFL